MDASTIPAASAWARSGSARAFPAKESVTAVELTRPPRAPASVQPDLARPNARRVGLIGSGSIALPILQGLCAVRPIDAVNVYSPTREHREAFAERAGSELGIPVAARDTVESAIQGADILAVATNARAPVVTYEQLRPGIHVTSFGLVGELDASVYLQADQLVAASREQEIENAQPTKTPGRITGGVLYELLTAGSLTPESITDLGSVARGDVAARNGCTHAHPQGTCRQFKMAANMDTPLPGAVVALLIGLLLGLERERSQRDEAELFAGIRTFPILTLGGYLAAMTGQAAALAEIGRAHV